MQKNHVSKDANINTVAYIYTTHVKVKIFIVCHLIECPYTTYRHNMLQKKCSRHHVNFMYINIQPLFIVTPSAFSSKNGDGQDTP
jgi:hypothetical protein